MMSVVHNLSLRFNGGIIFWVLPKGRIHMDWLLFLLRGHCRIGDSRRRVVVSSGGGGVRRECNIKVG
jgi:hypothetical protein